MSAGEQTAGGEGTSASLPTQSVGQLLPAAQNDSTLKSVSAYNEFHFGGSALDKTVTTRKGVLHLPFLWVKGQLSDSCKQTSQAKNRSTCTALRDIRARDIDTRLHTYLQCYSGSTVVYDSSMIT
jgi:hypothetical protein